jgi:hypothetical protein
MPSAGNGDFPTSLSVSSRSRQPSWRSLDAAVFLIAPALCRFLWIGTYAGKGNGDYRGELASALRAITGYLKHFAFPPEMALIRLDGAYGDATVVAQLLLAGTPFVTRWRGYLLLEHSQIQRALAHAPTASMTRMNNGQVVELFEGGWLELGEGLSPVRVMVARHPAPPPGKDIPVGKRVVEGYDAAHFLS